MARSLAGGSHIRDPPAGRREHRLSDIDLVVWGRATEEHEPAFSPLAHISAATSAAGAWRWRTASSTRSGSGRSVVAHLRRRDRDTGWDYVALGHQHVQTDVSQGRVTACYAGAPAGEGSTRPDRSVLHVELSEEHGVRVTPRSIY
jgi:hypothetical protein